MIYVERQRITFDLETKAHPEDELFARFSPVFEPKRSLVDPNKIKADVLAKRQDWLDESTLRAERSRILALGYTLDGGETVTCLHGEDEVRDILLPFIQLIDEKLIVELCGFNILGFDLPYFRRRCLLNRVPFPFYNSGDKWNPWTFATFDAMVDWQCGNRQDNISLDTLARALGIEERKGDWREFAKLYETDPDKALEFVRSEVRLTSKVVEAMRA